MTLSADSVIELGLNGRGGEATRNGPRSPSGGVIGRGGGLGIAGCRGSLSDFSSQCLLVKPVDASRPCLRFLMIHTMATMQMSPKGTKMPTRIAVVFEEGTFWMTMMPVGVG